MTLVRREGSTLEGQEFLRKNICTENLQNARILHENSPKDIFPVFFWGGGHLPPNSSAYGREGINLPRGRLKTLAALQPVGTGRMTDGNARILSQCDSDTVFVDGTFRTAPRPYKQVTIHVLGLLRGTVLPLCFCLVSGKTVGQYRQLLSRTAVEGPSGVAGQGGVRTPHSPSCPVGSVRNVKIR